MNIKLSHLATSTPDEDGYYNLQITTATGDDWVVFVGDSRPPHDCGDEIYLTDAYRNGKFAGTDGIREYYGTTEAEAVEAAKQYIADWYNYFRHGKLLP